jgi:NadR type nicotinamide-nucleotide adenylyltransferase
VYRLARVVVTGSECTGKTTLAGRLAEVLRVDWVPEYSREFAASVDRLLTSEDVAAIARGHMARADAAASAAAHAERPYLVLDTDLVSTCVYAEHYYGACPSWIGESARQRLADLYLMADIDLPWEADGIRDMPHARQVVQRRFARRLHALGATVLPVSGLGEARVANALAALRGWRAARSAAEGLVR